MRIAPQIANTLDARCVLAEKISRSSPELVMLSRHETTVLMNTSIRQLEDMHARKQGPIPIRLGHRTVRYRASDVLNWLAAKSAQ